MIVFNSSLGGQGGSGFSTWDEKTETGWGDSANSLVWVFDGGAGTNEIGQGSVLAEANRTLTQNGAIGAAVLDGGYFYRPIVSASSQYFNWTDAGFNGIFAGQSSYSFVWKYKTGTDITGYWLSFNDTNSEIIADSTGGITFFLTDTDNAQESKGFTDGLLADTLYYFYLWCDGIRTRIAFSTTFKTKWSEFDGTKRNEFVALFDNFANHAAGTQIIPSTGAAGFVDGRMYFMIASKSCLVTND